MHATEQGHLDVVRLLLGHHRARAAINQRDNGGATALWKACRIGRRGVVVRALLESGADITIANNNGITPVAIAVEPPHASHISARGRRECVAARKVRVALHRIFSAFCCSDQLADTWVVLGHGGRRRSGPTCSGRPGRWRMQLRASRRR
jgi:hypothetical protein